MVSVDDLPARPEPLTPALEETAAILDIGIGTAEDHSTNLIGLLLMLCA